MSEQSAAAYAEALPGVVWELAEPHVSSSGDRMVHLEWNPAIYPGQEPECFAWQSDQVILGVGNRLPIAERLQPGYEIIRDGLIEDEKSSAALEVATDVLSSGDNMLVVTPHDKIVDIAVALLAAKDGIELRDFKVAKTAIMLSKMLSGIGYKSEYIDEQDGQTKVVYVPAITALGYLCDITYLSWPNSESAREHTVRLPDNERRQNNNNVVKEIHTQLNNGGVLLGSAVTGTTKVKRSETGVILPDISPGTKKIMTRGDTWIMGMILELEEGRLSARIPNMPVNPDTKEGVDEFKSELEDEFNKLQG